MKRIGKKLGSVLLALCFIVTLMPTMAFAADASSLENTIESYSGGTGTLSATVSNDGSTITVTGTVTGAASSLSLDIGSGVTVVWQASITASDSFSGALIELDGDGTFEVAAGGAVTAAAGEAILVYDDLACMTITVSGGTVSATTSNTIDTMNDVTVSGGTVSTTTGNAISAYYSVTVSGGTITATGNGGTAIDCMDDVTVSGGTVSATNGYAIIASCGSYTTTVSGGVVFAYGDGTDDLVDGTLDMSTGDGVAIAWDQSAGNTVYTSGTDTDLTVSPTGAATWAKNSGDSGISYKNGSNSGFIAVSGVTVAASSVSVSTAADLKTALESTTASTIYVTADMTFTEAITQGADHTLNIASGVTVTGESYIGIGSHTLTIDGGGTFVCDRDVSNALYSNSGTLDLENITVNVISPSSGGICVHTVNVEDGAAVNLDSSGGNSLIQIYSGYTLTISTGGAVSIDDFMDTGIYNHGTIYVNGGTLTVGNGGGSNYGINNQSGGTLRLGSGTLNATNGATIHIYENSCVEGVSGKFIDRGTTLTNNGTVTAGKSDGDPSADGLAAGSYIWNGSAFERKQVIITAQPQDVTVTEGAITESLSVTASAGSETVYYQWLGYDDNACDYFNISGATGASYALPTGLTAGTYAYKCALSASGYDVTYTRYVTVTVNPTYAVTVGGGTANLSAAAAGATVTVTANAPESGKQFKEWTVVSGGAVLADSDAASTTFSMPAEAVELTATYEDLPVGAYSVTVQNDGGGTANADVNSAAQGTEITLTAVPGSGYQFKGWQVVSGSVTLADADAASTTFSMPAENVTVKAVFESISYTITFDANGGSVTTASAQTGSDGKLSSLPTPTRSGSYSFSGWYTAASGGTNVTADTVFSADTTLYAHWTYTGSSGGGTSGSSSGESSDTGTSSPTVSGSTATTTVTAEVGSNGTASASVTQSQVSAAISAAQKAAGSTGKPGVEIQIEGGSGASAAETTLPEASAQALASGGIESLTLSSSVADMTFDAQALATIADAASGDVTFTASQVDSDTLSEAAQQVVGDRPVFAFSVTSGGEAVTQFGGNVTISVPYTLAAGEDPSAIVAYYINADGEPELLQNCYYDAEKGVLVINSDHFSEYAVGYNKVSFTDVADDAWYADAVSFIAARGITSGTSETTFSPEETLTRGQFITLMMRAYGIDPDDNSTDNFSDAGDTYYTGYLAAAKSLGISSGVGDNNFAPEQAVTRQEMFTLLYNALDAVGQLPEGDSGKTLSDFTDSGNIASYAQEAMAYLVEAGIIGGNNGQLSPTDTTTRAQMAQVLYNLLSR